MEIVDLKAAPEHCADVADRIWRAWWAPGGAPLEDVERALAEVLAAESFPFTLVASEDGRFFGTVTAIVSDIAARPNFQPCIAALWVEPEARGRGLGECLMAAALQRLAARDFRVAYLAAKPPLRDYYSARGWHLIEGNVGEDMLDIFKVELEPVS